MAYNGQYRIVNVDGRTGCTQSAIFVDEAAVSNVTTNREVSLMSGKYKIDQDVSHPLLITSRQNNRILLQFRKSGAGPTDQPHTISMTPRSAMELLAFLNKSGSTMGLQS